MRALSITSHPLVCGGRVIVSFPWRPAHRMELGRVNRGIEVVTTKGSDRVVGVPYHVDRIWVLFHLWW